MKTDEIDQKQLKTTRQAFINLSQLRFKRMEASLSPVQSDHLKLLPLLFHVNHPMLPGYVDKFTPKGLPNYNPSMLEKQIVKTVSQSFEYKPRAHIKYSIAGLYLMGSMGTLGQSIFSDIDLWICLDESLEKSLLKKLTAKANKIKAWLAEVGIELNHYLVNVDDFSNKKDKILEKDSCGNTQNFLLLDEFYRTAVWIAGRWPLWWLVPNGEEYESYVQRLIQQKHLEPADWIDFGEVKNIPANEYFSAALWQLYKAIESPYKSSVKLLALEVYAKQFPCAGLLSNEFKNNIYQGLCSEKNVDPYYALLTFAEKSLADNSQRLEFLRRAFYLKANVKITTKKRIKESWRYRVIRELCKEWKWKQARLDDLNHRNQWTVNRIIEERKNLMRELTRSYQFLCNFSRLQGVINKVSKLELLSLGRQLYATFERRNQKIERINFGIIKDISKDAVTISHHTDKGWRLYINHYSKNKLAINQSVFAGESLFECLCWGCANGIIKYNTRCQIYSNSLYLDQRFANEKVKDILSLLKMFSKKEEKITFKKEAIIISFGIFINTRSDPLQADKNQNLYRVADKSDCLSWTENKTNLASHFDQLSINSWGELNLQHFSGPSAWLKFFKQEQIVFLNPMASINIFCRGLAQREDIIKRIKFLLGQWKKLLNQSKNNNSTSRYLMRIEKKWFGLTFFNGDFFYFTYPSLSSLLAGTSEHHAKKNNRQSTMIKIDDWLPVSTFIKEINKRPAPECFDCYLYQESSKSIQVVVRSRYGAVHFQSHKNINIDQVIGHYQQFFDKVCSRSLSLASTEHSLDYYRYFNSQGKTESKAQPRPKPEAKPKLKPRIEPIDIKQTILQQDYLMVQASAVYQNSRLVGFDFFTSNCNYHYLKHHDQVYSLLVKELLSVRKEANNYPVFLTDLDFSAANHPASFIELLERKRLIEENLQRVMKKELIK